MITEPQTAPYTLIIMALLESGPMFGDELGARIASRSEGALTPRDGEVIPVLQKLERSGWVASGWQPSSVKRRRLYEITEAGRAALDQAEASWRAQVEIAARLLSQRRSA